MVRNIGASVLLAALSLTVWMNRFQYEHSGTTQVLVRINRFTGQQCFLTSERGWDSRLLPVKEAGKPDDKLAETLFGSDSPGDSKCQ